LASLQLIGSSIRFIVQLKLIEEISGDEEHFDDLYMRNKCLNYDPF